MLPSQERTVFVCVASAAAGVALGLVGNRLIQSLSVGAKADATSHAYLRGLPESAILLKAANFSAVKHKDQRRKNAKQVPYICHPISVARILAVDCGVTDVTVLAAALLHDTVEDTDTTLEEIEAMFGKEVASIVDQVSDDKTLPKEIRKQMQIDHAPHHSREAKLVKLADKLDNLTDLTMDTPIGWGADRVSQYFIWAEKVIHGLRGTHAALEEKLDTILNLKASAVRTATATLGS